MKNIIITAIILILISGCSSKQSPEKINELSEIVEEKVILTSAQLKNTPIIIGEIEQRELSSLIKVNGKIDVPPQNMVSVSMPLGGYLKTTKLLPGMHLTKGEIIASMEDLQYIQLQQEYLITKSKLQFAETEFNRQKELNQSKAISDKVFQQTQMDYNSEKISLCALAEKLKLINIIPQQLTESNLSKSVNIYSPIEGFVSKVNVNIGKYVNPADVLFELVNTSDIHLNLKVFEKDLEKLSIGQKVIANTNLSDKKHICEIILISQDISDDGTAEVHCHFKNYDKTLLPGMYMNAEIEINNTNSFVLPEDAVVAFEGKEYIFISINKNEFILKRVETGKKENNLVEILNGKLFEKKQIVTKGAYTLLMTLKNKTDE